MFWYIWYIHVSLSTFIPLTVAYVLSMFVKLSFIIAFILSIIIRYCENLLALHTICDVKTYNIDCIIKGENQPQQTLWPHNSLSSLASAAAISMTSISGSAWGPTLARLIGKKTSVFPLSHWLTSARVLMGNTGACAILALCHSACTVLSSEN